VTRDATSGHVESSRGTSIVAEALMKSESKSREISVFQSIYFCDKTTKAFETPSLERNHVSLDFCSKGVSVANSAAIVAKKGDSERTAVHSNSADTT
jgi:hypothetical protein